MIKHQKYTFLFLFFVLTLSQSLISQSSFRFILQNQENTILEDKILSDTTQIYLYVDSLQREDFNQGYLLSSIDRWERVDSTHTLHYFKGDAYKLGKLSYDRTQEWIEPFLDDRLRRLEGQTLKIQTISETADKMITRLENSGYPFASVQLDSLSIIDETLTAMLKIDRGDYITFDTIKNIGTSSISNNYLRRYLNVEKGAPFDKSLLVDLDAKLKEVSFFKSKDQPQIAFINKKAEILLNLEKSKSSNFDFIIGLLQNTTGGAQRYSIVADFTAEMRNQLGFGERFFLQFQRLRPENQTIDIAFEYPYILNSPFGVNVSFGQFRNEDQWIDREFEVGGQYYLQGRDYLKVAWNNKTSNLITIDTTQLLQTQSLPQNLDISYNGLTLGLLKEELDYRFNPSRGYEIALSGNAGLKNVRPNLTIESINNEDVDFATAYDTIELNTYELGLKLDMAGYIPINRSVTIKTALRSALKYNQSALFQNDLFRIGGNRILRGFDEQSVLSSFYSVFTAELRFILAQESNNFTLSLPFIDYALEYNPLRPIGERWDRPLGIGVGMNFQTTAGIFSFAMAVGKRLNNPFDFGNLKIHFGYINLF